MKFEHGLNWPAGRTLDMPELDHVLLHPVSTDRGIKQDLSLSTWPLMSAVTLPLLVFFY